MQEGAYAVSQTLRVVAQARKRCRATGERVSYHGALLWCSFDLVHGLYGFSYLPEGSACVASRQDCWDFTPVFGWRLIRQIGTESTSKSSVGDIEFLNGPLAQTLPHSLCTWTGLAESISQHALIVLNENWSLLMMFLQLQALKKPKRVVLC